MYGDTGSDKLNALDGYFDYVDGGPDPDTSTADAFDQKLNLP